MRSLSAIPGRALGSVSLRYRQPITAAAVGEICQWLVSYRQDDDLPVGEGPTGRSPGLMRLEAILFLAEQPESSRRLAQLAGLADGTKARTLVRELNKLYDLEGCAFRVEEVAGGFQLMSRSKFAPWLRRLQNAPAEVRLSAPAMETLAVVAYRQPVLRAEIEAIRGVQCGEILRQLIERELVRITGRSEELGRPFLYGTSKLFLQVFGLRHLDELPNYPHEAEKEMNVKASNDARAVDELLVEEGAAAAVHPESNDLADDETPDDDFEGEDEDEYDDYEEEEDDEEDDDYEYEYEDDEEEDEEEEDEDLEDEPWEEVEEDEDEEEEYEEEDEDWDEDEDWEDEDWEEEEDEDDEEEE